METLHEDKIEKLKKRDQMLREGIMRGTWQLRVKLTNKLGIEGFSGRMIGSYKDPTSGKDVYPENAQGGHKHGVWIDKVIKNYKPSENRQDLLDLDHLIKHPEIGINNEQVHLDDKRYSKKRSNPLYTLKNLDHQDVEDIEQENYIDQLVGYISSEKGKTLGLDRTRYILNALGLQYREEKLMNDPGKELLKLKSILKKYVRSSYKNAENVNRILDNMKEAQYNFEITEMVRINIIDIDGAVFKYRGRNIGISKERVVDYFEKNPDFYQQLVEELYTELRK